MSEDIYAQLVEKFEFLTIAEYGGEEFIGIVQNCDHQMVTMYDLQAIPLKEHRHKFLELGNRWWYESNRFIPINIFLKNDFQIFRPYLKTFIRKEFKVIAGPMTSLQEMLNKRIKRKTVQMIKS